MVSIEDDPNPISSEDFAIQVYCHSNISDSTTVGLEIMIESEILRKKIVKYSFTCSNVVFPQDEIVCEEINNVTVPYSTYVYVTSIENEDLSENCLLESRRFVIELSKCQSGKDLLYIV